MKLWFTNKNKHGKVVLNAKTINGLCVCSGAVGTGSLTARVRSSTLGSTFFPFCFPASVSLFMCSLSLHMMVNMWQAFF